MWIFWSSPNVESVGRKPKKKEKEVVVILSPQLSRHHLLLLRHHRYYCELLLVMLIGEPEGRRLWEVTAEKRLLALKEAELLLGDCW